jgi:alkylation response protein AidB-like acyl-CoA dehydrogenase
MDFELDETQRLIKNAARGLVAREIEPLLAEHPPDQPLPKETVLRILRSVHPLGVLGARIPVEAGGSGLGHLSYGLVMEELPPVAALIVLAQETTATRVHLGGSPELKARFLPPLLAGARVAGSATSEPNVGSDPRGVETRAVRDGDGYVLRGRKIWVSNGSVCDVLMTVVSLGPDAGGQNQMARFLVEKVASPFEAREIEMLGLQQGHLAEVVFEGTRVPAANQLGETGDAHGILTTTWLTARPLLGLMATHLSQRALDASVRYARERKQFGRPIGSFQLVQQMIVEMATLTETGRLLCYRALDLLDKGRRPHRESSMAKYWATEAAVRVTHLGIQVHGSYGLTKEFGMEKLYRDARMFPLPDGTTQIQQLICGRDILGIRAFA